MAEIVMPQLGESVTEGTITRWFKQVGESVAEDEPLFEVSTDKVDTEVPATQAGVLSEIRVPEGDTVDVGTVLAVMGDGSADAAPAPPAEAAPQATDAAPQATEPAAPPPQAPAPAAAPAPVATPSAAPAPAPGPAAVPTAPASAGTTSGSDERPPLLSPLVRRLVEEHGIDPATLTGTGVGGRLTRDDVLSEIDRRAAQGSSGAPQSSPAASSPAASSPAPVERLRHLRRRRRPVRRSLLWCPAPAIASNR